jgi:hypothetical protein
MLFKYGTNVYPISNRALLIRVKKNGSMCKDY